MRVEEDNKIETTQAPASSSRAICAQAENLDETGQGKESKRHYRKRHKQSPGGGCLKLLGCLGLTGLILLAVTFCLVIFVASPLVGKANELPSDFPSQIAIYQLEKAKIAVQDSAGRAQVLQLMRSLPDWLLSPFINYLATEAKTQILSTGDPLETKKVTIGDLEKTLTEIQDPNNKTVSLVWDDINKDKEDLAEYYKNELLKNGFGVKENLKDYEININFIKDGVTGAMTIADSFSQNDSSLVKMTVNYLTGN